MIPPKDREGLWKQITNYFKGADPYKSYAEEEIKKSILEVLPDPALILNDDRLMTGEAAILKISQVIHCMELQHEERLVKGVSRKIKFSTMC